MEKLSHIFIIVILFKRTPNWVSFFYGTQVKQTTFLEIGDTFGKLIVIGELTRIPRGGSQTDKQHYYPAYPCRCECGTEKVIQMKLLLNGNNSSCGCGVGESARKRFSKHGGCSTRIYSIWSHIIARTTNPNNSHWHNYGGRGIHMSQEWREDFTKFRDWALANGYSDDLSIERVDVNKGYQPDNCTWIPLSDQGLNTTRTLPPITAFGETKTLKEWASDPRCAVTYHCLHGRVRSGWNGDEAITIPA